MSDQSRPANWIAPARVALVSGMLTVMLAWLAADMSGMESAVMLCPLSLTATSFGIATLLALVLMWAGRPLDRDAPIDLFGVGLMLEYLAIAALGVHSIRGSNAIYTSDGWVLVFAGVVPGAFVGFTTLVLRESGNRE